MKTCSTCLWWLPNRHEFKLTNSAMCLHPEINWHTLASLGCARHVGSTDTIVNVPQHIKKGSMEFKGDPDGPVEILIVTYGTPTRRVSGVVVSDFEWLHYCLRSIQKFCRGFQGVTIAIPNYELEGLNQWKLPDGPVRIRIKTYDEEPGKGFLNHEAMLAHADILVPEGTKYVLHNDADGIFRMPTTPDDYFAGKVPYYLVRTWDSLITEDPTNPGSKCISDCYQWKAPTEAQLGFQTEFYTMCMNTNVFPVDFYARYRDFISGVQDQPFLDYMLSGRNAFPQDRMDHTAMGAWAYAFMREQFRWIDVEKEPYPQDRKLAFWSHAGIGTETAAQLEDILTKYQATPDEVERMSQ